MTVTFFVIILLFLPLVAPPFVVNFSKRRCLSADSSCSWTLFAFSFYFLTIKFFLIILLLLLPLIFSISS
jgi:hypothetical protein